MALMQPVASSSVATDIDLAQTDLGPLAWVLEELRKAVGNATRAMRRFVQESDAVGPSEGGTDHSAADTGPLRIARQQLHQAAGAMDMVGQAPAALLLRAMEAAVQQCVDHTELCNEDAVRRVERASFGLLQYLEAVLHDKPVSPVGLFPQYRDVQALAGQDRVHPADLWPVQWRWTDPDIASSAKPLAYDAAVRARFEQAVLKTIKSANTDAARLLRDFSLGFAAAQSAIQPRVFWKISAGFFEALSLGLCPQNVYTKRASSRVLQQYTALVKGELGVSDRLVKDLVFFCAQAQVPQEIPALILRAIQQGFGLAGWHVVDYENSPFGHFDPALLAQARKRISAAKEAWSSVAGGDLARARSLPDQFSLLADSLVKLHPPSTALAIALTQAGDFTARSGVSPSTAVAMEVATSVMFLEAAFEELDPADMQLTQRTTRLAQRLACVQADGEAEPLEPWIEELYRRVSDRQTMGSVVGELRSALGELERVLDPYFRNPKDASLLVAVPGKLSQMRGVLSVLGLDQAVRAVLRMRDVVEQLIDTEVDAMQARATGTFDKLGNNLGALGLLFDMLNYQPVLAKKLFVFDEGLGELRPVMGRTKSGRHTDESTANGTTSVQASVPEHDFSLQQFLPTNFGSSTPAPLEELRDFEATNFVSQPAFLPSTHTDLGDMRADLLVLPDTLVSPQPDYGDDTADLSEDDLLGIFLEEAREVVQSGSAAIAELADSPADLEQQTILRRAFHTLKGSSRMVGLDAFGEAAWSLEQLMNTWLADRRPVTQDLRVLSQQALQGFAQWAQDIAAGDAERWSARMFQAAADALRLDNRLQPIEMPHEMLDALAEADVSAATDEKASVEESSAQAPDFTTQQSAQDHPPFAAALQDLPSLDIPEPVAVNVAAEEVVVTVVTTEEKGHQEEVAEEDLSDKASFVLPLDTPDFDFSEFNDFIPASAPSHVMAPGMVDTDTFGQDDLDAQILAEFETAIAIQSATRVPSATEADDMRPPQAAVSGLDDHDEQIKIIGTLRIGIPLYNVYLNEADEWSRRLLTELTEWTLELHHRPLGDSTVSLAHSLAGSSATVGFSALSGMARELERAMEWTQLQTIGTPEEGRVFTAAAEDIRRLLHQFAAGFLKEPNPDILEALRQLHSDKMTVQRVDSPFAPVPEFVDLLPQAKTILLDEPAFVLDDDDLEAIDALDPDLFQIFEEEASDLLPMLGGALRQWVARPDNRSARAEVLRVLHTLKGSARLAGAMRLGERAHRIETAVERLEHHDRASDATQIEPLLTSFDALQTSFDALRLMDAEALKAFAEVPISLGVPPTETVGDGENHDAATSAISALPLEATSEASSVVLADTALPALEAVPANTVNNASATVKSDLHVPFPRLTAGPVRAAAGQAVRIRSQLLDRLVNQTGEVMMTRSRLEAGVGQLRASLGDLTGNLERLRQQLRDVELQAELQMQSRLAQTRDAERSFDPLEFDRFTRVQELTRMMAESVNDVATVQRNLQRTLDGAEADLVAQARQTRELQRDLLRTRMMEFELIAERLYRVVRQAAKDSGKQVKLDITGGSIEMDRGVLDRMTPAFEHLLRNAVAHGVEDRTVRETSGKPPVGTLSIHLHHEGNDVSIAFSDDGAGLNRVRIRTKALALGLITPEQTLEDADLLNLVFMPGFSTAAQVTELSGRGIGMDVVRAEVLALGGRIESSFVVGQGTRFNLVLPLTTAVTQVVMVRSGRSSFGVPANVVEQVRRTPVAELTEAYASGIYSFGGEDVPFFWSGALLQASTRSEEPVGKTASVIVFRSAQQRIAMHVDEVLGNQEVVVKNLGPQLSRLPGLSGMTVLASGAVVLIYNPVALASVYGVQAKRFQTSQFLVAASGGGYQSSDGSQVVAPQAVLSQVPLVLVVDDSITVRRVTQRLLQREGYRVALAVDGIQALERLRDEIPAVLLSDIEMPRMDGFELARSVRVSAAWKNLPIITISSRTADKHREMARDIGVNHYLGKPYSEEELLSLIRRYATPTVPVQLEPKTAHVQAD